jgi:hypothetical protein
MKHVLFAAFLVTSAMSLPCLSEGVDFARCALSSWEGLGGCLLRHLRRLPANEGPAKDANRVSIVSIF